MYRVLKLSEAETPEAMQKIADKQMPCGGYRYIATHAIGPGTLPKDITVFNTEEVKDGKIAIFISRPLTSEELKKYDIKPEWIQEDEEIHGESTEDDEDTTEQPADIEDKVSDEIPDEEYMVDKTLNELRDVLVDLDWNLFMIGNEEIGPVYIIGRLKEDGVEEMLVPDGDTFKFIGLPDSIADIIKYKTVYGDKGEEDEVGEDAEIAPEENIKKGVPHEEIMNFLMNKLIEINPEAAEEKDIVPDKDTEEQPVEVSVEDNLEGDEE